MTTLISKYKIYGRKKGRKKNNVINQNIFKKYFININDKIEKNRKNILDIGSGNGENSLYLSDKYPNGQIISCDIFQDGNLNLCNKLFNEIVVPTLISIIPS